MKFARRVFLIAGIYGVVVLLPQYFLEQRHAVDRPPAITHAEYYYGFVGVALAFIHVSLLGGGAGPTARQTTADRVQATRDVAATSEGL